MSPTSLGREPCTEPVVSPLGPRLPLTDLAVWTGSALIIWLFVVVLLDRLGSRAPAIGGALLSWLLARVLVFGVPELVRWADDVLDLTGQS
jgi:hypothetical protein